MWHSNLSILLVLILLRHTLSQPLFSSTPVQINTQTEDYFFYFDSSIPLDTDVDIVALHDDYYGIPWSSFLNENISLPISWLTRLNSTLEAALSWNRPVYLAYEMLSGPYRTCPAQNATDGPNNTPVVTEFQPCTSCYDFSFITNPFASDLQKAYALYVSFMIEAYLKNNITLVGINLAAEINLGAGRICSTDWFSNVVNFYNGVYTVIKNLLIKKGLVDIPVFPSIQLETLMGVQSGQVCNGMLISENPSAALIECITTGLKFVEPLKKDAFGISTYPPMINGNFIPPWYVKVVLDNLLPKDRSSFLIAETGWNRVSTIVNLANGTIGFEQDRQDKIRIDPPLDCVLVINSSITLANNWLIYLINLSVIEKWKFLTWWSDTDLLYESSLNTCPCSTPLQYETSCTFITAFREIEQLAGGSAAQGELVAKSFGSMGLRGLDNSTTLLWDTVQSFRQKRN
jgi:hypothetical protein